MIRYPFAFDEANQLRWHEPTSLELGAGRDDPRRACLNRRESLAVDHSAIETLFPDAILK
jgi:hypothetical protein